MHISTTRYSLIAITLHWLLALLILGSFSFGLYMVELPFSPARIKQFNWHKWVGITILGLSALRLLWRLTHRPPAAPAGPAWPAWQAWPAWPAWPAWQVAAAQGTHGLLYALFFAVPLAGWAYSSAAGFPVVYFGVLPLPDWVSPDPALADTLKLVHRTLNYTLAALVVLHVAAALKHHFVDRDGVLRRMLP